MYKEAFHLWGKTELVLQTRLDKATMQVNSVRNEVYQLIGFYTVFQGVILTAAAQSSVLKCHNWWTTFFLGHMEDRSLSLFQNVENLEIFPSCHVYVSGKL